MLQSIFGPVCTGHEVILAPTVSEVQPKIIYKYIYNAEIYISAVSVTDINPVSSDSVVNSMSGFHFVQFLLSCFRRNPHDSSNLLVWYTLRTF